MTILSPTPQQSGNQRQGMLTPPWTPEQVEALNRYQREGMYHPYTCPGDKSECGDQRELVATTEGWVCQCGAYRQTWAHAMPPGASQQEQ